MNIKQSQKDMRFAYINGAPGMFVSGVVWLISGVISYQVSPQASILALFIGGMFIHPLSMLIAKASKRPGNHTKGNPLAPLAIESTFLLFIGLFIAFSAFQLKPELFFPIMLMIIGGRYLLFQSMYGLKLYWFVGAALALSGMLCILLNAEFTLGAFIGAGIEIIVAILILMTTDSRK
jgi:hypothetical protein